VDAQPLNAAGLSRVRSWFRSEARPYPWTFTEDPYALWISEVMLQQTVVTAAVVPFGTWMARWPDLTALAQAAEDDVLRAWEGLGYASRAKNLHRAARTLVSQEKATLPSTYDELRALPGVGDYTASALLSFAFHQSILTLDANLKRVFQRLDAAAEWTGEVEARWRQRWAVLVDGPASRESNQALMQLGQRVCRARSPLCGVCPLAESCLARAQGLTDRIPAVRPRFVEEKETTVVFWHRGKRLLWWLARPTTGRFSHLWLAPPVEAAGLPESRVRLGSRVHTYTRYRDRLTPFAAPWEGGDDPSLPTGWEGRWATAQEARNLGMVSVYRRIWEESMQITLL